MLSWQRRLAFRRWTVAMSRSVVRATTRRTTISTASGPPKTTCPLTQDIDQLQVATGGLGAEFGDVTGGVISIFTKGPASKFSGGIEMETSGIGPVKLLDRVRLQSGQRQYQRPADQKARSKASATAARSSVSVFPAPALFNSDKDDIRPAIPVYRIKDEKFMPSSPPIRPHY